MISYIKTAIYGIIIMGIGLFLDVPILTGLGVIVILWPLIFLMVRIVISIAMVIVEWFQRLF